MTKNIRESELALKTWTPLPPTLDTDVVSDPDIVGNLQQVSQLSSDTSSGGSSMHDTECGLCWRVCNFHKQNLEYRVAISSLKSHAVVR